MMQKTAMVLAAVAGLLSSCEQSKSQAGSQSQYGIRGQAGIEGVSAQDPFYLIDGSYY